jgi:cytochrome c-type biogenesis protein CcmH
MHRPGYSVIQILAALWVLCVLGSATASIAQADDLDDQVRAVAKRLQCPICESVSVADSPSELAGQMRALIRTRLEQGESSDEIVAYFVQRYGETVLVEPPRHGVGLLVWLGPVAALLAGGLALFLWLRPGRRRSPNQVEAVASPGASADDWRLDAARRELDELSGRPNA